MSDMPEQLPAPSSAPGEGTREERPSDRRESLIWSILAGVGLVAETGFGFIEGMHFVPGKFFRRSIWPIVVSIGLMILIPLAVKVNHELGLPGGPLITRRKGEKKSYPWSEVLRDAAVWTVVLAIVDSAVAILLTLLALRFNLGIPVNRDRHRSMPRAPSIEWLVFIGVTGAIGAGVEEEILFRFVLMAILSWVLVAAQGNLDRRPTKNQLWLATILQGYCFGLVHVLPGSDLAKGVTRVSSYLARAIFVPQTWIGMVFARLYLKRGLEASIATHIIWDLILGLGLPIVWFVWMARR
jgi:membrane protease YdiL (CAAX protease family)